MGSSTILLPQSWALSPHYHDSQALMKIYKPTNNNLRTSSNTSRANQDNSPRINRGTGYDNQKAVNVDGARENIGTPVVQKSGIQCYNYKEYGHVSKECQKPKRVKDAASHRKDVYIELGYQMKTDDLIKNVIACFIKFRNENVKVMTSKPNKFFESSNKELVGKLKGEIEDVKTKKYKV
ncbi:uncharacterized mitochondrial protein-like protein [Tanacetum coccineum]